MRQALLIAALVLVPACKKFPDLGGIKLQDYLPKVKFDRMKVDKVDFQGLDVTFDFDVENPYPVDLRMKSFQYDLALEGAHFLNGDSAEGIALKASDTAKVKMPARIVFADVFQLVGNVQGKDDLGFGLKGKLGFDTPAGAIDVPFDEQGTVPTLKAPQIEPKAIRVADFKPLQNRATLELDLAVTNKAKSDAYTMKDFAYGIDLSGRRVLDGDLAQLSVAAGTTETRTIPIHLNLLELGATLVSAIQQKKPVDVHFGAGLGVETPLGTIPLDVDETVNLRIQ
ncbi:MAG: LEA type 2 family protein [Alphaproteobacteria bacterium]|nr:LEA type 2 family protein [Alphaproteobacteria bacterium]